MNGNLVNRAAAVIIWTAVLIIWLLRGWWIPAAGLFLLHFIELFAVGLKTGRAAGKSAGFSILMTLVFGVTWWKPLRDGAAD